MNLGGRRNPDQAQRPPVANPNVIPEQVIHQIPLAQLIAGKSKGTKENLLTVLEQNKIDVNSLLYSAFENIQCENYIPKTG